MAEKRKAILLRISPELWDALNRWAGDELRSVNAQVEYVLRDAVRQRGRSLADEPRAAAGGSETDKASGRSASPADSPPPG